MSEVDVAVTDEIVEFQTYRWKERENIIWVEIKTAEGIVGLGETYYIPGAVEAVVHEMAAPLLLGESPFEIEKHWNTLFSCANFYGYAGAEMRAFSAIDIALWDILGQATGRPVYGLLGGRCRDRIKYYNTCVDAGQYTDGSDFLECPGELAQDLLEQGITAMKVWPWDRFAPQIDSELVTGPAGWSAVGPVGHYLSAGDLREGLVVVEEIRDAVGHEMEILIEGHSRWDVNCAVKIARALEAYDPFWMEDMILPDSPDDLARLAAETSVPHSVSERLFTRQPFRQVFERDAAHVAMFDLIWTGGITESQKIAILADTYHLGVAPHDCTGPVNVFACLHICANAPNAMVMETVRAFWDGGYYEDVVTNNLPVTDDGYLEFPSSPGLGTALQSEFKQRNDVVSRRSR